MRPGAHLSLNVGLIFLYICFTCKEDTQRSCVQEGFGSTVKLGVEHGETSWMVTVGAIQKSSDAQPSNSLDFRL